MFEKRPILGLIVGLNVWVLIWLMIVQESVILDDNTAALSSSNSYAAGSATEGGSSTASVSIALQQKGRIDSEGDLYHDMMSMGASTLSTLDFSNNSHSNTKNINDVSTSVASVVPHENFQQLIDLQNFQFLIHQPVCGNHIEALILIHSAPKNHEKRQIIRETWASIGRHIIECPLRVLFLLGAVNSKELQHDLEGENYIYRDIVQGSFIDDYRNMTYKHIMAFKWFLYNCSQAQILIKVDDDVYVNTPQLIKYLKEKQRSQQNGMNNTNDDNPTIAKSMTQTNKTIISKPTTRKTTRDKSSTITSYFISFFHKLNIFAKSSLLSFNASQELFNHPQNLLFCQKRIGSLARRSYRSKWRVNFKEYSTRTYPPYCPGYAIIYSPDVIFRLYTAAQKSKYFWVDDVQITGVLAQQTNTTITTSNHYVLRKDECDKILTGKTDLSEREYLFIFPSIPVHEFKLLWRLQMMSIPTPKAELNDKDGTLHQRQYHQEQEAQQSRNDNEYLNNNKISSSYTYTSSNGFR